MIWFILFLGCVMAANIVLTIYIVIDNNNDDGYLYIYPDEKGRMCTVASFDPDTAMLLEHGGSCKKITLHVVHLDMNTRKNVSPYNEESSTTVV